MKLYNNPQKRERECRKCHRIKPYNKFKNRSDLPEKKRSICKKCEIKMEAERLQYLSWVNKLQAIKTITKNGNNCQFCGKTGIEELPKHDFHHPIPEKSTKAAKKKGFWRSVRYNSWQIIKSEISKQGVLVMCRNCHAKNVAKFFMKFRKLILHFQDPKEITPQINPINYQRKEIRGYIRKKIVFFDLWEGKCQICGFGINNKNIDNLPALTIHHQKPELKTISNRIFYLNSNIGKIKDKLLKEHCVCLCSNCHMMINSTFYNAHKEEIFRRHRKIFGNKI